MSKLSRGSAAALALAFFFCLAGERAEAQYRGPTGFRGSAGSSLNRFGSMGRGMSGLSMGPSIPGRGMTRPRSPIVAPRASSRATASTHSMYSNPVRPTAPRPSMPGRPR